MNKSLTRRAETAIITTKLSVAEVLSALNRRRREANITATEYAKFSGDFLSFVETDYEMFELSDAVLLEAQRLLETHPLRSGDAIQLASALLAKAQLQSANLPALIFLASDVRLLSAAKGFQSRCFSILPAPFVASASKAFSACS